MPADRIGQSNMGHGNAGHPAQPLTQLGRHLLYTKLAVLAVNQSHIDAGVHLALRGAGVDGGQGVTDFGEGANHGFDLARSALGHLQRGARWRVKAERGFRKV